MSDETPAERIERINAWVRGYRFNMTHGGASEVVHVAATRVSEYRPDQFGSITVHDVEWLLRRDEDGDR